MRRPTLNITLIKEVFFDDPKGERLSGRLNEAQSDGAELAVLPESPLDPWVPATREPDGADAEEPGGHDQH